MIDYAMERTASRKNRVKVQPELLRWARERARLSADDLEAKFPNLGRWEKKELDPTLKQLEAYAKATRAPIGYLFLSKPPDEPLPIPDFRTIANQEVKRPSPDLLDTIYICQQRQDWYRSYAISNEQSLLQFVDSATVDDNVMDVAKRMREALGFDLDARRNCPTWTEALRLFIKQADAMGVLVMCSGVVMNNNRRRLDPREFRGFALADDRAPLVFINGADTKAAQMFTLSHELAHLWLGSSALSDATVVPRWGNAVEGWCNRVAAELLAPQAIVAAELNSSESLAVLINRLARRFKVSTLVILRRLLDVGYFNEKAFQQAYDTELQRLADLPERASGGDFYLTTAARVSKRFARALVESTLEGRTLYRDAFRLLGISKTETFLELGRSLKFNV